MDVHKPHPIRHWRELLTEVGVIVLSVCIALAGEQAVEWLHWQGEVKVARQAIQREIAVNSGTFARRIAIAPCLKRQYNEAEGIIDDLEAGREPRRFTVFHPGNEILISDSEWQSERSAQSLTHFPREELALMGSYYAQKGRFENWIAEQNAAWQNLDALRHPPKNVAAGDLLRLRAALATIRETERSVVLNATRLLGVSSRLGITSIPGVGRMVEKFCTLDEDAFNRYLQSSAEPRQAQTIP